MNVPEPLPVWRIVIMPDEAVEAVLGAIDARRALESFRVRYGIVGVVEEADGKVELVGDRVIYEARREEAIR